jgi:hypothetical protein
VLPVPFLVSPHTPHHPLVMQDQPALVQTSLLAAIATPPSFMLISVPLHHFPPSVRASARDLARRVRLGLMNLVVKILPTVNRRRVIAGHAKSPPCTCSGAPAQAPRRALATLACRHNGPVQRLAGRSWTKPLATVAAPGSLCGQAKPPVQAGTAMALSPDG